MERDKKIEKIVRESSLLSPSSNFTEVVLTKIAVSPVTRIYKPLVGRNAAYIAIFLVVSILLIAIFSTQSEMAEPLVNLPKWSFNFPEWNISLPKISWKIPTGILAGVAAVFILILSDAGYSRSRS
jgi:hypothetical protein